MTLNYSVNMSRSMKRNGNRFKMATAGEGNKT
jgi:hypothetical protein